MAGVKVQCPLGHSGGQRQEKEKRQMRNGQEGGESNKAEIRQMAKVYVSGILAFVIHCNKKPLTVTHSYRPSIL